MEPLEVDVERENSSGLEITMLKAITTIDAPFELKETEIANDSLYYQPCHLSLSMECSMFSCSTSRSFFSMREDYCCL